MTLKPLLSRKHSQSVNTGSLKKPWLHFSGGQKIFHVQVACPSHFKSSSHHNSLRNYKERNDNWQNQEQVWKLAALLVAAGQRCKPLGSQKKGHLAMERLLLHTQLSPPARGALSSQTLLLWLHERQEKWHVLLPLSLCTGERCTSPTKPMLWPPILFPIQSLGAASMGKLAPGKPSTAALHPLCASVQLWVRSAKAAYSTTGLSNRTAGLN